jgi:WD40 repeat protein/serine/threonine protein kinase
VTGPSWGYVKELLHQAVALGPESRAKFLDEMCRSDAALRTELESLLAAADGLSAEFLQSPLTGGFGADGGGLSAARLAAGQLFAQRFQLIRELGEGGMGQVWLAEQIEPVRRRVALKLIRAGMYDETVVQRFRAERQSLAIMDHPAIAKVFDAGATPQGQPYFVMEYVPGLPITEYCDQQKLKIRQRVELFVQVCDGVQHAHQKAIIHRDLKPANILVIEIDGKPVPRIIDFGIAKATTSHLTDQLMHTRFGQFIGTPGYMSPEQVNSNILDIDTRADVYSLGVILYELLTGLQPFEIKHRQRPPLEEWLRQLRADEPPRPSVKVSADRETSMATATVRRTEPKQLASVLRGDLDWITLKALERDRERRYGTPAELAAELRRYLNDEPIMARPANSVYQIVKFVRRHRVAALVAGMVTTLAIVASGAGLIAVRKQHEAEYQAAQTLQAQSRLLTQAAAQRLKDGDVAGAQGIILEVLTNPRFTSLRTPAANSAFQDIRAADVQLAVLSGHGDIVISAAFSPDGTRIVTASADRSARIWDARTGAQLAMLSGHGSSVYSADYSPDGTRIVTASNDKTARIWDARTGAQLAVLSGHRDEVNSAAYSPDGARIVTASTDRTARIWDARTGVQLAVLPGHGDTVYSAVYSPDGTRIVTASDDKTARVWDVRTGAQLAVLSGHGDRVDSADYSPDGTRIVTASFDKTARIWDARTGAQLAVLSGHGSRVYSAAYSPDGTHVVTASLDKTARIWDARVGAQLEVLSGHGGFVYSAAYSPDGTRIVTASNDKTARVWDAGASVQLAVISGHDSYLYSAAYSPDGTHIVTASVDKTARIWDARTGGQLAVLSGHGDALYSAAYAPDGTGIVTASADKTARIWDARTGAQLAALSGHAGRVYRAAYSPDGTRVVTASFDKTARIWDVRTGVQLKALTGHGGYLYSASYSRDGTRIVTASGDRTARIWDARTGAQLAVMSGHGDAVISAAYSPDGTRIVTASADKSARIWDAASGAQLAMLAGHRDAVISAAYSPDGTRIVTASGDRTARIWDARTAAQLAALTGNDSYVYSAAYSPDGTRIVTASFDKTARIWDARVPAGLGAQILWDASAVTDPLPEVDRTELGLPHDARVRSWPTKGSGCDQAAAAVYDPDRLTPGVLLENITVDVANPACSAEIDKEEHAARADYQMGRTTLAKGNANNARQQFETAVARGYRTAGVDLADLLTTVSAGVLDPARAVSLYRKAWQDGVTIAAFRLGHLYESGLQGRRNSTGVAFQPDAAQAWSWYQQGADAGEPSALARFAELEESAALASRNPSKRNAELLQAFRLYAAAATRAYQEDWPDDAWKHWRYRRASLARLLAQDGLMQEVADAYREVLDKATPR